MVTQQDLLRGSRGLGYTLYDLIAASGMEDCNPRDSACVGRNAQRDNAAVDQWLTVMSNPDIAYQSVPDFHVNVDTSQQATTDFMANRPLTSETVQVGNGLIYTDAQLEARYTTPATTVVSGNARIVFSSNRGGSVFQPGDSWSIEVIGARPGAIITASQPGMGITNYGSANSAGYWKDSGTFSNSDVGSWSENWMLDGVSIGTWNFRVGSGPVTVVAPTSTGVTPITQGGTVNTTNATSFSLPPVLTESLVGGIPNWMLLGGAVLGFVMLKGGR